MVVGYNVSTNAFIRMATRCVMQIIPNIKVSCYRLLAFKFGIALVLLLFIVFNLYLNISILLLRKLLMKSRNIRVESCTDTLYENSRNFDSYRKKLEIVAIIYNSYKPSRSQALIDNGDSKHHCCSFECYDLTCLVGFKPMETVSRSFFCEGICLIKPKLFFRWPL